MPSTPTWPTLSETFQTSCTASTCRLHTLRHRSSPRFGTKRATDTSHHLLDLTICTPTAAEVGATVDTLPCRLPHPVDSRLRPLRTVTSHSPQIRRCTCTTSTHSRLPPKRMSRQRRLESRVGLCLPPWASYPPTPAKRSPRTLPSRQNTTICSSNKLLDLF